MQGEGLMLGVPMAFVRLAGCSVGCPGCDTNYSVHERLGVAEIVERLQRFRRTEWVWITGGEPTDQNVGPLVRAMQGDGYRVALATAGVRDVTRDGWRVHAGRSDGGVDFLSVSPHFADDRWVVRGGTQLNVVPGLNGVELADFAGVDATRWSAMYATPYWDLGHDRQSRVAECVEWVARHPSWRLGVQAHKYWGVP